MIEVRGDQVRLGIDAPKSVPVHRRELLDRIRAENVKAAGNIGVEAVSKALGDAPTV